MFDIPAENSLYLFINQNAEALQNAAILLGGPSWLRRIQFIINESYARAEPSSKARRELQRFARLLLRDAEFDFDGDEGGFAAMLDPASPAIEDICLLTDGLLDAPEEAGVELVPNAMRYDFAAEEAWYDYV